MPRGFKPGHYVATAVSEDEYYYIKRITNANDRPSLGVVAKLVDRSKTIVCRVNYTKNFEEYEALRSRYSKINLKRRKEGRHGLGKGRWPKDVQPRSQHDRDFEDYLNGSRIWKVR